MTYLYPPVGAILQHNGSCLFTLWAPKLQQAEVYLTERDVYYSMIPDGQGYWTITVPDVPDGTLYRFRLNHDQRLPDPASRAQPSGVHGDTQVVSTHFDWHDDDWTGMRQEHMVIYELHVGTFSKAGTFQGIIDKLDYLVELGVTTLQLMPVAAFPGARNWGYDGVFPFAVHEAYGGAAGLKHLVDRAHAHGLAVVLDVVYNHLGPEGNYLEAYGPYFTDRYRGFWGRAINFDDAYADGVREFFWQNACMWLEEFHLDGLRLDAVHAIWDSSACHFVEVLAERVEAVARNTGRHKILLAELDLNNPRYVRPRDAGGYGLHVQWSDEYHHALHVLLTGEQKGYYEDFGEIQHFVQALRNSYVYTGQYSVHRKRQFGRMPQGIDYTQFVVFAQNHDQVGNRLLGDRLSTQVSEAALRLAAAAVLLSPHVPLLWMGEEYGEERPFQYFISHSDTQLVDQVRQGRRKEFASFAWEGEVPDPQDEATFEACKLSWSYQHTVKAANLLSFYQFLIRFRKQRMAMQGTARDCLRMLSADDDPWVMFERAYGADAIVIALNFHRAVTTVPWPLSRPYRVLLDSSHHQWGGPRQTSSLSYYPGDILSLEPYTVLILE